MESLCQRFDSVQAICFREHKRPTDGSINKVAAHFGIQFPREFVQLAKHSKNYSAYFLGIGSDYESPGHMIRVNSYWRRRRPKRRVPRNLIIITEGYMDDMFWCFDASAPTVAGGDYAVQFWCPDEITYPSDDRSVQRYPDFGSYMDGVIKWR
jgi:hypothetical protein